MGVIFIYPEIMRACQIRYPANYFIGKRIERAQKKPSDQGRLKRKSITDFLFLLKEQ